MLLDARNTLKRKAHFNAFNVKNKMLFLYRNSIRSITIATTCVSSDLQHWKCERHNLCLAHVNMDEILGWHRHCNHISLSNRILLFWRRHNEHVCSVHQTLTGIHFDEQQQTHKKIIIKNCSSFARVRGMLRLMGNKLQIIADFQRSEWEIIWEMECWACMCVELLCR